MKLRFGIVIALLALLVVAANVGGSGHVKAQSNIIGGSIWGDQKPAGSGGCSQATAFLARVTTSHTAAYTTMICGMVTDGTWGSFDVLWILATDTSATALTNLVSSSFPLTNNGAAVFTANTGYTGGSSGQYLSSTYQWSTGTNFKQNSAMIMAWSTGNAGGGTGDVLDDCSSNNNPKILPNFSGSAFFILNSTGAGQNSITVTNSGDGLLADDRSSATAVVGYQNGVSGGSTTLASVAAQTTDLCLLGRFSSFPYNVAMGAAGGSLGSGGQASAYSRIHTFLHTVNPTLFP
jgi:hypothetical protein